MAGKRAKPAGVSLPLPGDVFLMPLADGRFGICRVLRENTPAERKGHGCPRVLVAAPAWIGTAAPDLGDPALRDIQKLTHHSWKGDPNLCWVSEPPPEIFRHIGTIAPDDGDRRLLCAASGGWGYFTCQVLAEWRWYHDREAVLREDVARAAEQARAYEEAERRRREARGKLTLDGLAKKRRFMDWRGNAPAKATAACRAIFRETVAALAALGPKPGKRAATAVLRQCVERLNALDEEHGHFVETTIAEDLIAEIEEIAAASDLGGEDLADRWRAW
jgi:hypothetical protein